MYLTPNALHAFGIIILALASDLKKQSPKDILLDLSKVYLVELNECNIISEIPRKLETLDAKLGFDLFPKNRS
jgi:hypothetical protein